MIARIARSLLLVSLFLAGACHGSTIPSGIHVSIENGHLVYTDSIRFESDSARLAAGSSDVLDAIASLLSTHSGIAAIRVEGHTDAHGSTDHNHTLSTERANAVADYLRAHGVTQPITTHGFGHTRPLCSETSEDCDARNRRVEFYVTSN